MNISELKPRTGNADVEGEITSIEPPRTFSKFGKEGKVANATLKDDSGSITLTLWNDQFDQVKVGDRVKITKGWVGEWQGENQLSTGKFGSLEILGASGATPPSQSSPSQPSSSKQESTPARSLDVDDVADEKKYDEEDFEEEE